MLLYKIMVRFLHQPYWRTRSYDWPSTTALLFCDSSVSISRSNADVEIENFIFLLFCFTNFFIFLFLESYIYMNWVGFFVGYKVTIVGNKNLFLFNKNNMSGVTPFYFFFFFYFYSPRVFV